MGKLFKKLIGLTLGLAVAFGFINTISNKESIYNGALAESTSVEIVNNKTNNDTWSTTGEKSFTNNGIELKTYGVKTGSSSTNNYGYWMINNGYIASTSCPDNTFISSIKITFTSGTGEKGKIVLALSEEPDTIKSKLTSGSAVKKSGSLLLENDDSSKKYFTISNIESENAQISKITVTYEENSYEPEISFEDEFLYKHVSVGDSFQYKVKTENIGDAQVTFSSDNEEAATIDPTTGVVNCLSVSVVNITASVVVGGETYSVTTELWIFYGEPEVYKDVSIKDIIESTEYNSRAFELEVTIKGWGIDGTDASPNDYGDMLVTDGENDFPIYGLSNIPTDLVWDGQWCNYTTSRRDSFNSAPPCNLLTIGSVVPVKGFKVNMGPYQALSCVLIGTPTINELSSISITPIEGKKYYIGDSVSPDDFVASVTHSLTGNESVSSKDCVISPESFTASGENVPVTVSYTDRSGTISNTYYVSVEQKDIDIEIITIDEKDNYVKMLSTSTYQLRYSYEPQTQNETIIWESENPEIATVDENGLITPVSEGIAIISATGNRSGESDLCMVEVVHGFVANASTKDVITISSTGVTGSSYKEFSGMELSSDAVYAGRTLRNTEKNKDGCMQLNGTSGYIYTTKSGGTFNSFSIDCCFFNGKTINVYGSHSPFTSSTLNGDAEIIASLSENGTAIASDDYEYIAIRTTGYMAFNSITVDWKTSYTATIEDIELISSYVDLYLGPDVAGEYDPIGNKGTGLCISDGLYADAKKEFNETLTDEQRAIFVQDDYFAKPKERLLAWALANNDSYDSETNKIDQMQMLSKNNFVTFNEDSDLTMIILLMMSSSALLGLFVIYKKKKEQ